LSYFFEEAVTASDLPRIRFHDLRHTAATLALEAGVPVLGVQNRLGHATASITLDVYGHLTDAMDDAAADAIERAILGRGTSIERSDWGQ
jgi:integrase